MQSKATQTADVAETSTKQKLENKCKKTNKSVHNFHFPFAIFIFWSVLVLQFTLIYKICCQFTVFISLVAFLYISFFRQNQWRKHFEGWQFQQKAGSLESGLGNPQQNEKSKTCSKTLTNTSGWAVFRTIHFAFASVGDGRLCATKF